ncbi:MAG: MFS transporter [Hyphomicrobiaceae bacterium]|nr:MFS transporter [Hyphomicrobiaceae bacterium]
MLKVINSVWALLLGIVLILMGIGMQTTLISVRGAIENFSSNILAVIIAIYFFGYLLGARLAPQLICHVGHVRVFAALGSIISASLIAFEIFVNPLAWMLIRFCLGFCMSGVYVTAESWLNNIASNTTRGRLLSAYMLAQTIGVVLAQGLLTFGNVEQATLFITASILVSLSFAPILLSVITVPSANIIKPMSLLELYKKSPLGTIGILLLGVIYSAKAGMGAVYAVQAGFSIKQTALFVAVMWIGSLISQYPIGWLSDQIDRRTLIALLAFIGVNATLLGYLSDSTIHLLMLSALLVGGIASPLYSMFVAHTNDFLRADEMASASSGLIFVFGAGAILGPIIAGQMMQIVGPKGFWLILFVNFISMAFYTMWRIASRSAPCLEDASPYVAILPISSPVALEAVQEWSQELSEQEDNQGQSRNA